MGFTQTSVTEEDFFKENVVNNIAALLGISPERIVVMKVVSENSKRKRRSVEGQSEVTVSRMCFD